MKPSTGRAVFEAGLTLQAVQVAEHQLTFALTWIFPKDSNLRLYELYRMGADLQKRTLGQLVRELRQRADIRPDFDSLLADFIARRNRFAHSLFTEDDYLLESDAGSARATEFMLQLQDISTQVDQALLGHLVQWGHTANVPGLREFTDSLLQRSPRLQQIKRTHEDVIRNSRSA